MASQREEREEGAWPEPHLPAFIGFHYDIARGSYLKPAIFKDALRVAAAAGFTHFIPYLETMIRLPSAAKASPACAYDAETWREFEAVARDAGIGLVPHFNVIGHSELYASAYPQFMGNAHESELEVDREEVLEWTDRCLKEFCAFSPSPFFLIGGDEWQAPNSLLARPGFNVARAWVRAINRAVACLEGEGRTALVWHDMAVHYPEALVELSRKATILVWYYDRDSGYPVLDLFRKRGFRTFMAGGLFEGMISGRAASGFACAMTESRRYGCEGILMTSWEDCRWEFQRMAMVLAGRRLRGTPWPRSILEAGDLRAAMRRLPPGCPPEAEWRRRLEACLASPEWDAFPEARATLRAEARGDETEVGRIYERSHFAAGLGERVRIPRVAAVPPVWGRGLSAVKESFGLEVDESPAGDAVLRFRNGGEVFAIDTRYGGVLQDWRLGETVLMRHSVPRHQSTPRGKALPGGYRSHTGAVGFRPIWALGTHSNPCILWQHPYAWKVVESGAERVTVEVARSFYHVDYRFRIGMRRSEPGFWCEAHAINRLPGPPVAAAFSFNLALALDPEDVGDLAFDWEDGGRHRLSIAEAATGLVPISARERLDVRSSRWRVSIFSDPAETAGYEADWAPGFYVTPDLHGVYRERAPGEETVARWRFVAVIEHWPPASLPVDSVRGNAE